MATAFAFLVCLVLLGGPAHADVPRALGNGATLPNGAVPNAGTQQQELTNITAPAEWNVFEFVVTCGACHAGTQDQHTSHFGNWAGGNMASAARDPIFRANQIGVNNTIKAVTGQDGAGNVCMRCHSPNGWLSGRFDPTLGGKADGSSMIQSILLSTDNEGIMCETCHRAVGSVTYQRPDVKSIKDASGADTGVLDKVWNLLAGLFDWEHAGNAPKDQAGTPTIKAGNPMGDTTLQYLDGMTYVGKYSGMTDVYFSDLPIGGSYTGQIYAVYPENWVADGNPVNPVPVGQPEFNSAGQTIAYAADGTLPPIFELPRGTPTGASGSPVFQAQAFSIEHPTVGGAGRGGKMPFVTTTASSTGTTTTSRTELMPPLPKGPGGSVSPNEFISTSEFCGSCHELTVPVLNHGMPEQRTFSEWKYSSYSKPSNVIADPLGKRTGLGVERCQDCHMPMLKHEYTDLDNGTYNSDPFLVGGFPYGKNRTAQGGTSLHKLTGSNRDLPQYMKVLYPEVDLEILGAPSGKDPRFFPGMLSDRGPMWDRAKQNTEITLRDGVDVNITQAPVEVAGQAGVFEMKVKVTNKSGHRIPSGYPDGRRFWLSVQAKDVNDNPVYVSGVYDDATATLSTTSTDPFKRSLGNVIDATVAGNNAVQVYERVTGLCTSTDSLKNSNILGAAFVYPEPSVAVGAPLAGCAESNSLLNNFILFDNRIPPKGFEAALAREAGVKFWTYDATTKVPTEDTGRFSSAQLAGGYDEVTYRFTAPTGSVLTASAELHWQTHTRDFIEHLRTQDASTVRPEGPPNPLDPNYPNVPTYLSNSINGLPLSAYTALDGSALNDNWGGIAYAAWLATGKGTPFMVKRDDTSAAAPTTVPTLTASALTAADPEFIDPVTLAPNIFAAKLTWTQVPQADGYTVWIRYGKDTTGLYADWDRLVTVGKDVTSHIENVLSDASPASPGKTYGFKVVAFNGKGEISSAVVDHKVASGLPTAPTGLTASSTAPGSSGTQITLNWTDNATNEGGFEMWRYGPISVGGVAKVYNGLPPLTIIKSAVAGGVPTSTGGPTGGAPVTGANTYVDTDAALLPAACYNYQIRAVTANTDVSTWTLAPSAGCTIAAAPMVKLAATATSGTRVDLSWNSNATGVASYRITRTLPVAQAPVTQAAALTSYADTNALPSTSYTYKVEVVSTTNVVLASATTTVTTPAIPLAPSAVTSIATSTQITVNWTDNSNNEDGFVLERSDNGGTYRQIPGVGAFLPPNATSYVDKMVGGTLLPNVVYQYRVKAINLVTGSSGYAMGTPVSLLSAPLAPSNFTAMLGGLPGNLPRVLLAWTDNSTNETGFNVQRHTGTNQCNATAGWTNLNQPANATAALNTGVSAGSGYCYRIQSTNTSGQSAWVTVTVTVPQSPSNQNDPAVGLTVGSATVSSLQVSFAVPQPAIGYQLRYGTGNKGNWTTLTQTAATGNITVTLGTLQSGTAYQVQVSEATTGGWSSWSNSRTGTTLTPPSAPSSPNVSNPGNCTSSNSGACTQTVTFSIVNANPSINGWVLQRCKGNSTNSNNSNNALTGNGQNCAADGAGWANLTTGAGAGNQSVSSTGLQDNTFYSYRVNRSNAIGTSSWSNVASSKRQ